MSWESDGRARGSCRAPGERVTVVREREADGRWSAVDERDRERAKELRNESRCELMHK